jgi:aminoglycoside phosphotransferase (APT) family kinase protein
MHPNELRTNVDMVRDLLSKQFPHWADLDIRYVESWGTDHDIYLLGVDLAVRLPRIGWASDQAQQEAEWLPRFAPWLPLKIPNPMAIGEPDGDYPFFWSICNWLPGHNAQVERPDLPGAAVDLAEFVRALRQIDTAGAPDREHGARGCPLQEGDELVRLAIRELGDRIDTGAVLRVWDASLSAAPWTRAETWLHGDLLPGNLLVDKGVLTGVIDFGGLNVGDPACDLQPAWNMFDANTRALYRDQLAADEDSWMRGRGWVVYQTTVALPYYWETNPAIVRQALHALGQVLGDFEP